MNESTNNLPGFTAKISIGAGIAEYFVDLRRTNEAENITPAYTCYWDVNPPECVGNGYQDCQNLGAYCNQLQGNFYNTGGNCYCIIGYVA